MRRAADERGAALVEFAVVVPVVLATFMAAMALLWLTSERSQVSGLARDAARFASIAHDPLCGRPPCRQGYPTEEEVRAYVFRRAGISSGDEIAVELERDGVGLPRRNERFTVTVRRDLAAGFGPLAGILGMDELVYASTVPGRSE